MVFLPETVTESRSTDVRQQLATEQKRLAKLWDAFKKQEDEYRAVERERDELWARVQDLEKVASVLGDSPTKTAARLTHLETENERLRRDVSEIGARLEENRNAFYDEQQRLAKLYKVYEDTEAQLERAQKELDRLNNRVASRTKAATASASQSKPKPKRKKSGLTPKQRAQRKYAASLRGIRKRAGKASGGSGLIKNRSAARALRRKLGLKS